MARSYQPQIGILLAATLPSPQKAFLAPCAQGIVAHIVRLRVDLGGDACSEPIDIFATEQTFEDAPLHPLPVAFKEAFDPL